jgi:CheY-like chemotaxis protein
LTPGVSAPLALTLVRTIEASPFFPFGRGAEVARRAARLECGNLASDTRFSAGRGRGFRSDHAASRRQNRRMAATALIVDDHQGFRASARRLLTACGYEVVGEAGDVAAALAAIERLSPWLVLLDVVLPDGDGIEIARQLEDVPGDHRIVLVSSREREELAAALEGAPVTGFLPKDELCASALKGLLA